jgi:hypothetical protein
MLRSTLIAALYLSAAPVFAQSDTPVSDAPAAEPGPITTTQADPGAESDADLEQYDPDELTETGNAREDAAEMTDGDDLEPAGTAEGEAQTEADEAEVIEADTPEADPQAGSGGAAVVEAPPEADRPRPPMAQTAQTLISAEVVEDAPIYSLSEAYDESFWDSGEPFGPVAAGWNEIGQVETLVIDNMGKVAGVTVDVGGFLGIGDNTVLIPLDHMRLVQVPGDNEEFFIVTRMTTEELEAAEEIEGIVGADD